MSDLIRAVASFQRWLAENKIAERDVTIAFEIPDVETRNRAERSIMREMGSVARPVYTVRGIAVRLRG